jgi:hypothetical protein
MRGRRLTFNYHDLPPQQPMFHDEEIASLAHTVVAKVSQRLLHSK